ncbi:hypothetical protein MLD38_020914 [Melastoma candidum]|uniref:Uncharacterized protein n=1 Tax=Melastoma candidum TaxID=119954 RepID=A0ACB9QEY7_9MYRT|nr:hypothetical protein MLD38_020914 [Melastoma candidum]
MMDFRKSFRWESRRSEPVMLLKEFLKDDLGSCSSGGFNSLPRRPSGSSSSLSASVRFLIDINLRSDTPTPDKGLSRSLSASLFRSVAVKIVSAVKLPQRMTCFLLLGGSQTEKFSSDRVDEDERRWSFFGDEDGIMLGKDAAASSILSCGNDSSRVNWDGNGMVSGSKDATVIGGEIVNGTDGKDGIGHGLTGPSSKECLQGKLPFSPVSVLDCCEDDELTIDARSEQSPGNVNTRGGKHRHDGLSRLAPAELEKQITLPELEEEAARPVVVEEEEEDELEEQEEEAKDNAEAVLERTLKTMKVDVPSCDSKSDVLLLDFFREKLVEWEEHRYAVLGWDSFVDEVVHMAEEWMRGKPKEAYVGWEIEGRRMAYIKDMERGGDLAGHEVCLEVDNVVWTLLVHEAIIDIFV